MHSNTKIICTIGSAVRSKEMIKGLVEKGMNIARINMSHEDHPMHSYTIDLIRETAKEMNTIIPIGLDTKGPELRISNLTDGVEIKEGDEIILSNKSLKFDKCFVIPLNNLLEIPLEKEIFVDDGCLKLKVTGKENDYVVTKALNNHLVIPRKKINIPGFSLDMKFLSDNDKSDILLGLQKKVEIIFASFVSKSEDLLELKSFIKDNCDYSPLLISKLESVEGMTNLDVIIDLSDGIMIARGDLAVEIGHVETFSAQRTITQKVKERGKILICATQMLESMIISPVPTRAEISDIGNAVLSGVDCVMLSAESAKGKYPLESVDFMHKACINAENIARSKSSNEALKFVLMHYQPEIVHLKTESLTDLNNLLQFNILCPIFVECKDELLKAQVLLRKNCFVNSYSSKKVLFLENINGSWALNYSRD